MNVEGLLIWRAQCGQCGDEFEADSLKNPYPKGLDCPTCLKKKLEPPQRLCFTTDAPTFTAAVDDSDEFLEGPIDEPT